MSDTQNLIDARAPGRALFARVGEALYGALWQQALARELDVSGRSVRYWVAGAHRIPNGVWADLFTLMEDRRALLTELIDQTRKAIPS